MAALAPIEKLPISHFSVFVQPPGTALMAAFKGYFDESGKDDDPQFADSAICVGGWVTTVDSWQAIEADWAAVLGRPEFDVPYLHMKEFAHSKPGSPFEKWKNDESRRAAFMAALALVIRQSDLVGVGAIVRVPDLARFNRDHGLDVQAYPFGVYAALIELSHRYPNADVETLWDKVDRHAAQIAIAREYADSDRSNPDCGARVEINPLEKRRSSKNVAALQMADFAAYELLKSHRDKNDWFKNEEPFVKPMDWFQSQFNWAHGKFLSGERKSVAFPDERKSYLALFGGHKVGPHAARPMDGKTWTNKALTRLHCSRRGIWSANLSSVTGQSA